VQEGNDFLLLRLTGLEYLASHLLDRCVSILASEAEERRSAALIKGIAAVALKCAPGRRLGMRVLQP